MQQTLTGGGKTRLEYLDTAKAIAILFVIICHTQTMYGELYSTVGIHITTFFIIAGLFNRPMPCGAALRKYAKAYLWPAAVATVLVMAVDLIVFVAGYDFHRHTLTELVRDNAVRFIYAYNFKTPWINLSWHRGLVTWFLPALFVGSWIVSWARYRLQPVAVLALVLCTACIGITTVRYSILCIAQGLLGAAFIWLGSACRQHRVPERLQDVPLWIGVLAAVVWCCTNANIGLYICLEYAKPDGPIAAIVGAWVLIALCQRTGLKAGWLGRNTLYVLVGHLIYRELTIYTDIEVYLANMPFRHSVSFPLECTIAITLSIAFGALLKQFNILKWPGNTSTSN